MNEAPVEHDRPPTNAGLQALSWAECHQLVAPAATGRLALLREGRPTITVVPVAVRDDHVLFTVGHGVAPFVRDAAVALEADHLDREEAWSVVATGVATEVAAHGTGEITFRLPLETMTGRLLNRAPMYVPADRFGDPAPPPPAPEPPVEPDAEWFDLLASQEVGRLAVAVEGKPLVFPVNYVVDRGSLVFRTDPGTKLTASRRTHVALEAGPASGTWSVVVEGIAYEITSVAPGSRSRLAALALWPWAGGDRLHYVRIMPVAISGSRFAGRAEPSGG